MRGENFLLFSLNFQREVKPDKHCQGCCLSAVTLLETQTCVTSSQ